MSSTCDVLCNLNGLGKALSLFKATFLARLSRHFRNAVFQRHVLVLALFQIPGTPLFKALPCSLATNDEAWNALVAMRKRVNGSSAAIPDFRGQDGVELVMATININSYLLSIRDKYLVSIQRHL